MAAGTSYTKRYAGGFNDGQGGGTPIDQQFLNAVEAALGQLIGSAPNADAQVMQWDDANTRFGPALLLNKNIAAGAAIAKSKLDFTGANGIVNADIAGAAAIDASKLAPIPVSKITGYAAIKKYTKVTPKQVVNTVAYTDMLNGEITVAAGDMAAGSVLRLTAWGDALYFNGATPTFPSFRFNFGGAVLLDTGYCPNNGSANLRKGWWIQAEIINLTAATQWANIRGLIGTPATNGTGGANFAAGEGYYGFVSSVGAETIAMFEGGNAGAVDTTVACALNLFVSNGAASANYDVTLKGAVVEII